MGFILLRKSGRAKLSMTHQFSALFFGLPVARSNLDWPPSLLLPGMWHPSAIGKLCQGQHTGV